MTGQKFTFTEASCNEDRRTVVFKYKITTDLQIFELVEKLVFPVEIPETGESKKLIRALHLALGISYYKSFLPPVLEHSYEMTAVEADFWNSIYKNGLGEFLYINKLPSDNLAKFTEQSGENIDTVDQTSWNDNVMLGIGGGKDSIVAGELLKEIGVALQGFVLATNTNVGQTKEVTDVMGITLNVVKRIIDSQIFEINQTEGSYNGHIPISLIFALSGALLATSNGNRYIVVANEASASIPQAMWEDLNINHQWSKSLEFERLFQDYLRAYISPDLHYFSAVRPLSSVAIAKIFAKYPKYFEVFTSDNGVLKIKPESRLHPRWNPNSTKSLSSYILLAPWMSDEDLLRTFGQNLLENDELENMCGALLGENDQVVLDCVGTKDELKASINELFNQNRFSDSKLLNYTKRKQLIVDAKPVSDFMNLTEHAMPSEIAEKLLPIIESRL
jgi:hypothetical protein